MTGVVLRSVIDLVRAVGAPDMGRRTISATAILAMLCFSSSLTSSVLAAGPSGASDSKSGSAAGSTASSPAASKGTMPRIMDFSAEWCVPCKKFAPTFDKVGKNYKNKVEFIHYDSEKGEGKVLVDKYKVNSLPTIVFIDAKGNVSKYEKGILTEAELTKRTEDLLK